MAIIHFQEKCFFGGEEAGAAFYHTRDALAPGSEQMGRGDSKKNGNCRSSALSLCHQF